MVCPYGLSRYGGELAMTEVCVTPYLCSSKIIRFRE